MSDSPITPATRFESYMADISSNLENIAQKMTPEGAGGDDSGATELYKLEPATRFESYMSDISGKLEQIAQNVTPGGGGGGGDGLPTTGGTMSGSIDMDGNSITDLPQTSTSGDAVSYGQVAQMVAGVEAKTVALISSDSTSIKTGADLDTFTTAGSYRASSSAIAGSLEHCPVAIGFRLLVTETTSAGRLVQILIANDAKADIYKRFYNGTSWNAWQCIVNNTDSILATGVLVTVDNYLDTFKTGSFNDAQPNTVIGIGPNVPLTDGPDGDAWIGAPGRARGTIRGTLITVTQANNPSNKYTGLVQMLIGYRNTSYKPTFSYRIATAADGVYTWSNWSKFEENGYLHASNVVVYNGTENGQSTLLLTDLNDAEPNSIYQIDLNCTEGAVAHHPSPGLSSVLMCYAFSYTTRHGMVQTLFNVRNEMYYRYGYLNDTDDYRWTPWVQVNTKMPNAPSVDGTYTLQCTVSNGTATYAWFSVT